MKKNTQVFLYIYLHYQGAVDNSGRKNRKQNQHHPALTDDSPTKNKSPMMAT